MFLKTQIRDGVFHQLSEFHFHLLEQIKNTKMNSTHIFSLTKI